MKTHVGLALAIIAFCSGSCLAADESADVVIYGGTSSGVIAAVQVGRMGKSVLLIEPSRHLGGMTSGGLGATDMGNEKTIGGAAREFYRRIFDYYQNPAVWTAETKDQYAKGSKFYRGDALFAFEPHVAEKVYNDMIAEAHVNVVLGERLDLGSGVARDGGRIVSIRMEGGRTFAGRIFIDASYEGDLMAKAGVTYTVGREASNQYGETLGGVEARLSKKNQFTLNIDPYVHPGDVSSGLVAMIHAGPILEDGSGDKRVQAYNYRICMTDVAGNRVPFPKPKDYDERDYELLLRSYEAGYTGIAWGPRGMPNRKTDSNNGGGFSTDFIGMADDYPDGDYAARARIIAAHIRYTQGLLWTVANSPRVPEKVRQKAGLWGLAKDEFTDNNNWPYQLYVREARRMVGQYVVTESDTMGRRKATDPIGLGSYNMDSHNCERYVDAGGHARNEGDVEVGPAGPYGISYQALVPKPAECTNLLVSVCMSASHIGYASIRMEPVYMIMGQACGTAACLAIDEKADVQDVSYAALRDRLVRDKQLVEWTESR